jgi:hypothetical protein
MNFAISIALLVCLFIIPIYVSVGIFLSGGQEGLQVTCARVLCQEAIFLSLRSGIMIIIEIETIANASGRPKSVSPGLWTFKDFHHVLHFSTSTYVMQTSLRFMYCLDSKRLHPIVSIPPLFPRCSSPAPLSTQSPSPSPPSRSVLQTILLKASSKLSPAQASPQSNSVFPTSSHSLKNTMGAKYQKTTTPPSAPPEPKLENYARNTTSQ